ncbi:PXA domain-domain-containing protein, partial [Catenaria anguillulae PL171]
MASSSGTGAALLAIPTFLARVAWSTVVGAVGVAGTCTVIALAIQLYLHKYPEPPPPVTGIGPMRESSVAAKQLYSKVFAEHHAKLTAERDRHLAGKSSSTTTGAVAVTTTARCSPESASALNEVMTRLLGYIQRDFVAAWFSQISDDPTFLAIVDTRLQSVAAELSRRATHLPLDALLVEQVVPALVAHLVEFRRAEQAVRGGSADAEDRVLTESLELHELVASKYLTATA